MGRRTLLFIVACTALVAVAASSAAADPIPITISQPTDFGSVLEGQSSSPQTLTIQNTGGAAITLDQLTLAGTDLQSFSIPLADDACSNATLAPAGNPGDTCNFNVVFNPQAGAGDRGVQTSLVDVSDTSGDDPQEVDFSGTAVAPQISVPASQDFGSVALGSNQLEAIQVVNNSSTGVLNVQPPTVPPGGDYSIKSTGTTCNGTGTGVSLNPGASCNVNVVFAPTVVGSDPGTLQIMSNDPDTPTAQVSLTGTGTQGAVTFMQNGLATSNVSFTADVGATSPSQTVSVTNTGTAPLVIAAAASNGVSLVGANKAAFAITGDGCSGQTLQVNGSCDVTMTFTAPAVGQRTASLSIKDNGTGGTQQLTLTGTGIQSGPITIQPPKSSFGTILENSSSSPQTFVVTNTGTDSVTFGSFANTFNLTGADPGDFSVSNDGCSNQTLAPQGQSGNTCSFEVTFSPPFGAGIRGARSASLQMAGGFVNSPASVSLTGTATAPALKFKPTSVGFGDVPVGGTPGQQTVTITNNGDGTLQIPSLVPSGSGFSILTDGCSGAALTAGQSCNEVLQFQPTATGAATGSLQINQTGDPDSQPSVTIPLSGNGTQVGPVTVSPNTTTDFGSVVEGSSSSLTTFTVTNTGSAPLTGLNVALGGANKTEFTLSVDNCSGTTVPAGGKCTFKVAFTPAFGAGMRGAQSASVSVTGPANAVSLPQTIGLTGTATAPALQITPSSIDFGNVEVGQSASQSITIKNTGAGTLVVSGSTTPSPGFSVPHDGCQGAAGILTHNQTCQVTVSFLATDGGSASGTLHVPNPDDPDSPNPALVTMTANGTVPGPVAITGGTGTFGSQVEGTTSSAQTFTVQNEGTAAVTLGPVPPPVVSLGGASPGSFVLSSNTCAGKTQLVAGETCAFKIQFKPPPAAGTRGAQTANVTVSGESDAGLPQTIPLSGNATAPTLKVSPTSMSFPNTLVGGTSTQSLTVQNTGTGTLTVTNPINVSGPFTFVSNGCSSGVSGSQTCIIKVAFNPTSPGGASGTLTFNDTDPDSSGSVPLSGTGTQVGPVKLAGSGSFGSVLEGGSSSPSSFTLHNSGNATLTGITEALSGPNKSSFSIGNNQCGATLAGGASCSFNVTFSPHVAANTRGSQTATLTVNGSNDSADLPATVGLTGTATAPQVGVPQNVIDFGNVPVTTSQPEPVTVTNTGQGSLSFTVSTMGAGFSANNVCNNVPLANGQSCTITVTYQSTSPGPATGTLQVASNDPDVSGTTPVTLTATGTQPTVNITGNTAFSTALGTTSSPQAIIVHNTGNAPLKITAVGFGGTNQSAFAKPTDNCNGQTVGAGNTCEIDVTFTAGDPSPKSATLSVTDNAPNSPHVVSLSGTALTPGVSLTPGSAVFAQTQIGVKSATQTVTIKNTGSATLNIGTITLGGTAPTDFLKGTGTGDTCTGQSIAIGKTCTLTVTFIPVAAGSETADVIIPNNSGQTADLPLSGTGVAPPSPASLNVALGCDSSRITWTQPTGQVQFSTIKIVFNASHAPTSTTDGTTLAHPSGYVQQTGLAHFHTFYYAAFDVYTWYNSSTKLVYSKPLQGSGHTGDICAPRNRGVLTDLTPLTSWLAYAPGAKYSVLLQQSGKTIQVVFPSGLSYQFPTSWSYGGSTHSFKSGGSYVLYVYAYTASKPDGFLIGMAQFTEA